MDKDNTFTFSIDENGMPKVTVYGNKLAVSECEYYWATANNDRSNITSVNVSGYFQGSYILRIFVLDFKTKEAIEVCGRINDYKNAIKNK